MMDFPEFIDKHYPQLEKYARYQCRGDRDKAQDLVQELVSDLAANRYAIDYNKAPLTYCQQLMSSIRRRTRRLDLMFRGCWDIEITNGEDIPQDAHCERALNLDESVSFWTQWNEDQQTKWGQVVELMQGLPIHHQEFLYRWCMGYTTKELAQWKGCSEVYVMKLFRQLVRTLHKRAVLTGGS